MVADATGRITRPRQIYTGELRRKFIPVYERQLSGRISGEGWKGLRGLSGPEQVPAAVGVQGRRPHPSMYVSLPTISHPPRLPAVPADFKESSGFRSNLLSRLVDTSARTALR